MQLAGVRRQLTEALEALGESAERAVAGEFDPAYRAALKSRNLLFHATRGLAAARGQELPAMPVVGGPGGALDDHAAARAALEAALAVDDAADPAVLQEKVTAAHAPYAGYLGFLRDALGSAMRK